MYNFSFFGQFFFCKHFYHITGFDFCKFANFIADSKSRAQELSNDVSFVIYGHQTWDLEGGQIDTPPSISWFSSTPAEIGLSYLKLGENLPRLNVASSVKAILFNSCSDKPCSQRDISYRLSRSKSRSSNF